MKIGELFVDLGFDVDDDKLKDFNDKIVTARNDVLKLSAVATGGVLALNSFMERNSQAAVNLQNFTAQTGFSADALQRWAAVIHETNPVVSIDEANSAYKRLGQTLIDIRQGKGNSGALAMLGVNYNTNLTPEETLEQIRSHLNQQIAQYGVGFVTQKLDEVGIGAGALQALQLSADRFNQIGSRFVISPEMLQANREYAETIADIENRWHVFTMNLAGQWAPQIVSALDSFTDATKKWVPEINQAAQELGGWKRIGEVVLAYFATTWTLGMLAAIGRVSSALTLGGIVTAATTGGAAVAAGGAVVAAAVAPAVPYAANRWLKWNDKDGTPKGWAEHLADYLEPTTGGGILDFKKGNFLPDWFYTSTPDKGGPEYLMKGGQTGDAGSDKNVTVNNNVTQNIHTTADAKDTANEAQRLLDKQNADAYQQLNLGPSH